MLGIKLYDLSSELRTSMATMNAEFLESHPQAQTKLDWMLQLLKGCWKEHQGKLYTKESTSIELRHKQSVACKLVILY